MRLWTPRVCLCRKINFTWETFITGKETLRDTLGGGRATAAANISRERGHFSRNSRSRNICDTLGGSQGQGERRTNTQTDNQMDITLAYAVTTPTLRRGLITTKYYQTSESTNSGACNRKYSITECWRVTTVSRHLN